MWAVESKTGVYVSNWKIKGCLTWFDLWHFVNSLKTQVVMEELQNRSSGELVSGVGIYGKTVELSFASNSSLQTYMNCCGVLSECVRLQSCFFLWECLMFRHTRDSRLLFQQDIFIRLCWVQQTAFIHPPSAAKFKNHDLDPSILLTGLNKVYPGWKHSWHCGKSSHLFVCGLQISGNTAAFLSKYVIRELVFHNMLQALCLVFAGTAEGHDDDTGHCVTGSSTSGFRPVWITPWGNGPVVRRVFADSQMVKAESVGQTAVRPSDAEL